MKCLHPNIVNIESGGKLYKAVPVPCGKCEVCLHKRAVEWQIRLSEELKVSTSAYFITLTYRDADLPIHSWFDEITGAESFMPCVCPRDTQLFLKRLRRALPDTKIRFFLISEYGPRTFRPHYHAIIFNLPKEKANKAFISKVWSHGFVEVSPVTSGRIAYVSKYCFGDVLGNVDWTIKELGLPYDFPRNFTRMSLRPAIGYSWYEKYCSKAEDYSLNDIYYFKDGYKFAVPSYYRKKYLREHDESDFEKQQRMDDYMSSFAWIDEEDILQSQEREEKMSAGAPWYETPYEQKCRLFLERVRMKYSKNRKL